MNKLILMIIERLTHLGEVPLCNGIASRAPHFFGYCFPLCYRCTFFLLCFIVTIGLAYKKKQTWPLFLVILCLIPMIVDGSLQTFLGIISTNLRRAVTGGLFGLGMGMVIVRLYLRLDHD